MTVCEGSLGALGSFSRVCTNAPFLHSRRREMERLAKAATLKRALLSEERAAASAEWMAGVAAQRQEKWQNPTPFMSDNERRMNARDLLELQKNPELAARVRVRGGGWRGGGVVSVVTAADDDTVCCCCWCCFATVVQAIAFGSAGRG